MKTKLKKILSEIDDIKYQLEKMGHETAIDKSECSALLFEAAGSISDAISEINEVLEKL